VSCSFRANDFGSEMFITVQEGEGEARRQFFVNLQAAGEHNAQCAGRRGLHLCGRRPLEQIKLGLDTFAPVSGRLQRKTASNGALVIDDTYNANPDSVAPPSTCWPRPPRRACWCWAIWAKSAASVASSTKRSALCAKKGIERCW
jgi:UDP-N-acetylmuramyl pentapeptide synthase